MARYPGNFTDSELLTLPRNLRTSPDGLDSQLAYVTQPEIDMIVKANPHGSMQGKPNKGPEGVPSLDGDYGTFDPSPSRPSSGSSGGGGSWGGEREDRGGGESQQDIINRNNRARIDKIEQDRKEAEKAAAGRQWDPRADDWRKDYSYSTKDVRSAPGMIDPTTGKAKKGTRLEFAERTGSEVYTNAERLARLAYQLTGNPNYLNQAIFIPKGMTGAEDDPMFLDLWGKGQEALKTGDVETFFGALGKTQDITAGNPNIDYSTSYDPWYRGPTTLGGGGGGWGGYGGYGGYGGGGGGYGGYGYGPQPGPNPQDMANYYTPQANLQQAMIGQHMTGAGTGFRKSRGGIVSLLGLRS